MCLISGFDKHYVTRGSSVLFISLREVSLYVYIVCTIGVQVLFSIWKLSGQKHPMQRQSPLGLPPPAVLAQRTCEGGRV